MDESIKVNGSTIIWMESVFTLGKTVESMRVSTKTTRSTASEFTFGQMAESIEETGQEVNSTGLAYIQCRAKEKSMDCGKRERE